MKIYTLITGALLPASPLLSPEEERGIAAFVSGAIRLAPFHLRMGVRVAEAVLLLWMIVTVRGFITGNSKRDALRATLNRFERLSHVSATLIRLYRSLIMLKWFEREGVAA